MNRQTLEIIDKKFWLGLFLGVGLMILIYFLSRPVIEIKSEVECEAIGGCFKYLWNSTSQEIYNECRKYCKGKSGIDKCLDECREISYYEGEWCYK